MVERGFDILECIIGFDCVGGNVVPVGTRCAGAGLFTGDVCCGEVGLEMIPRLVVNRQEVPFNEGLAVQARELDACEGACPHLFHGVWRRGDEGGNIAVFNAVKIGLDWLGRVPWRGK